MNRRYGRYEVLYKLGQGAMAQVFLARDPVLSRYVAIKVLHAELASRKEVLQRFFNEARTVAVVRNPHVVEVFDFGQEGKDLYLVMEFVDGLSLHGVLRQLRPIRPGPVDRQDPFSRLDHPPHREPALVFEPLDSAIAAALMCQAAEGLTQAAQHGVVHRDIKPENLMINQQGYLKISDFGIAHVQDDSITKTGAVLGSPLYMSPEQARGLKPITSQADMFSLGAVFYACLVGHPPFQGRNITDLFRKIATQPHVPLWRLRPDLDPALGGLIETLLQKNPMDRGGGPRWLHRQLKGYLMALGVMDPADLISGYVQELASRGIQTTWRAEGAQDPRPVTLPAGTLPMQTVATERYTRESDRRMPAAALGAVLGVLGMAAAGIAWGLWHNRGGTDSREATAVSTPGEGGALASFGPNPAVGAGEAGSPKPGAGGQTATQGAVPAATGSAQGPDLNLEGEGTVPTTLSESGGSDTLPSVPGPGKPIGASPPSETAALVLKSSPPFAEAFVDGNYMGVTPVRLESLPAGRHRVVLKIKRTPAFDTVLVLKPGLQSFKFRMDEDGPGRLAVTPEDGP
jgi:hypothetical protein